MSLNTSEHPSRLPFDISEYKGLRGKNFYTIDRTLQRMVLRYSEGYSEEHKADLQSHLVSYGEMVGGVLDELTEACHKEGKYGEFIPYDRTGNRIDLIEYSPEQKRSRQLSYEHGVVNLDFHPNWKHPFTPIHKYALAYLMNLNGEGGVACPLAMTDGIIEAIKKIGTQAQKDKYLPLVAGYKSESHFMAGQFVTERVGGSNVSANRTTAKKLPNGKWELTGEKWFCSNPGDLWVTTAKIEGTNTIGLFLVPRIKENGELNGHHILRKKDIIGSRGKLTVEIRYDKLEAEEFGRPTHGLVNLIKYIIRISRIHVGLGSCGNARRALLEAYHYAKHRTAYGKQILEFSVFAKSLAELYVLQIVNTMVNFRSIDLVTKEDLAQEVLIPLLKYKSSSSASLLTQKAILSMGGNGIIGDFSPLPRLHNDSIINETWEGTHLIITDHLLHALQKPKVFLAFQDFLNKMLVESQDFPELNFALNTFTKKRDELERILREEPKEWKEINRIYIADLAYEIVALVELIEQSVFDLKNKMPSSILYVLRGYEELVRNGLDAPREKEGIFFSRDAIEEILSY